VSFVRELFPSISEISNVTHISQAKSFVSSCR
jgi:hypothetical protein